MNNFSYFKTSIYQHSYWIILVVSLLFFIRKGIQYAIIGSYVPLITIVCILLLLSWCLRWNKKRRFIIRFWSILLIIWSTVRILLAVANNLLKEISNNHITHQLGIMGLLISLVFLLMGVYLYRKATTRFST